MGYGTVTVVSEIFVGPDGGPLPIQDLTGSFSRGAYACTATSDGSCTVTSCPPPNGTSVGAGVITVTGTTPTLTVTPNADGSYPTENNYEPTTIWNGGETITATAAGDVVPAFTISGIAPANLAIQTPALPPSGTLLIDRTTGLAFTWSSNGGGTVTITLSVSPLVVSCQFPQAPGGGIVPKAIIEQLPAVQQGTLTVLPTGAWTTNVSGWAITLQLLGQGTWGGTLTQSVPFTTIN